MIDPYAVLAVSPTATQADITHAYRRQLRAHHPDLQPTTNPGADERLRQILAAYALLRDPRRRAEYDRAARPAPAAPRPVRVTVSRAVDAVDQPPLRAGPVRRHR